MSLYNENVQINGKTREDKLSTVKIEKKESMTMANDVCVRNEHH